MEMLFLNEPCPLDILHREDMYRAWENTRSHQLGCWYPTTDDLYVFVGQMPGMSAARKMYWEALPRALLHTDGSVTITEPNYEASSFFPKVQARKVQEQYAHANDQDAP